MPCPPTQFPDYKPMSRKSITIYVRALLGYLIIGLFFPWLWLQGIYLKKVVLRLPTPGDKPFGVLKGNGMALEILGLGESTMAGVGIAKHSKTLTGLTAIRLNHLVSRQINWKILANNGLTIKTLNQLIKEYPPADADLIIVSIGGNDVFKLTPPWVWQRNLVRCVKFLVRDGRKPLILFSPVPCVGRFPAIPNPLCLALGYWELLLQTSLALVMNSTEDAHLLEDSFPDGKEYFLDDGIHPSQQAYDLWSEKLASTTIGMMQRHKTRS